jgi:hypothetical protein
MMFGNKLLSLNDMMMAKEDKNTSAKAKRRP